MDGQLTTATGESPALAAIRAIGDIGDPVKRNETITQAYEHMALRLRDFISATEDGRKLANWCTYAVWSSRTVGGAISARTLPALTQERLARLPRWLREPIQRRLERDLPTTRRTVGVRLAAGNRDVFLEVARAVVGLVSTLGTQEAAEAAALERFLAGVRPLELDDEMSPAPIELLSEGLAWYHRARYATSLDERSEQVLTGSLLVGMYEQMRLQRPIEEAFALGADKFLGPLVRVVQWLPARVQPTAQRVVVQPARRVLTPFWARLMTRRVMTLNIDGDRIPLGRPLRAPRGATLYPETLAQISLPRLRELLHELGLDDGRPVVARDWSSYEDRMRFIGAFFRSRQQRDELLLFPDPIGAW